MDLFNDPRFFHGNVLDKRLTAFTALSVIASLMAGAACDQFFPYLDKDMHVFGGNVNAIIHSLMQLAGFILMVIVLFLTLTATTVFGVQFYFTYRLMTAGPIGFESSRLFYLDPDITYWRHMAAMGLIVGMPIFLLSIGFMLFVTFDTHHKVRARGSYDSLVQHTFSWITLLCFVVFSVWLLRLGLTHKQTFNRLYFQGRSGIRPLLTVMETGHAEPSPAERPRY